MSKWSSLEKVLADGYASREYEEWYAENVGGPLPENFDPVAKGKAAAADVRKTFESGSKSDWMKNNEFSGAVVRAVYGFRSTKEWREAWMGAPEGPSAAQLKREEQVLQDEGGRKAAEKDFKRGRWIQTGKKDRFQTAYTRRMRELHGMSPSF